MYDHELYLDHVVVALLSDKLQHSAHLILLAILLYVFLIPRCPEMGSIWHAFPILSCSFLDAIYFISCNDNIFK